jgi:hypothetical protein
MPQFGAKSKKTSSDSKRHFTVVMGGKEHGLYVSSMPSSAARKAVSKLCASNKSKKVEFSIREITQGSKKKTYGPYEGYIEKLKESIELKERVIQYKPVAKLSGKTGAKKGGMRGGGEIILIEFEPDTQPKSPWINAKLGIDGIVYDCRFKYENAMNYINYFLFNKTKDRYYDKTLNWYIDHHTIDIIMDLKHGDVIVIRMNKKGSIKELFQSHWNYNSNILDKININEEVSRINSNKEAAWERECEQARIRWEAHPWAKKSTSTSTSTDEKQPKKNRVAVREMIGNFYNSVGDLRKY